MIKQRLEYHIYVNFSVQNLLYLTCTTHGMPNFLLVCGSVWVQLDMSPRKACQSIKKFHLFSFLIFWQKYHNTPLQWKFSKIKISAKAGKAIFQWLLIWLGKMIQSPFLKSNIYKIFPAPQSKLIPRENCKFSAQRKLISKNYILSHIFWKAIKPLSMKIL